MNTLSDKYKALFREELRPSGFLLFKKTFYRVINDVIQTLMLRRTETSFTVDFDIMPLCLPIEDLYCEGYDLTILGKRGWWQCYGGVEESAFAEMRSLFRQYVLPIFKRGINSKTAHDELVQLEKMIYTGVPGGIISHYSLGLMCIQFEDYEKAFQYMSAVMKNWDEAFQSKLAEREKKGTSAEPDLSFDEFAIKYQKRKRDLQKLSVPDIEFFQNYVAHNQAISLEYLRHPNKRRPRQLSVGFF